MENLDPIVIEQSVSAQPVGILTTPIALPTPLPQEVELLPQPEPPTPYSRDPNSYY